ncbi:MAG TPA: type I pullulanase [Chitinophagaceae bacterium]|nr:type I pullulanase [Chitinophagaceae bacterium]
MKKFLMLIGFITQLFSGKTQKIDFSSYPVYNGNDLGLTYTPSESIFKIWSPVASGAELIMYDSGIEGIQTGKYTMKEQDNGIWAVTVRGDQKGKFYAFRVQVAKKWLNEVPDPYAKIVGVNGRRAMVADLRSSDPAGWENDQSPVFKNETDAIIYEIHIRDASISSNSGIQHKGKFLGLTETGTKNINGLSTGIDHIKELGITHVHLLPCFDYNSIDETKSGPAYNWGYDPLNYDAPEGSYATDPYNGLVRIKEFKQLIKTFHENGLRVVMDVVYNHTALTENSNFNQLVPGYYYRQNKEGGFSNATACGNETASERPMFRKFMLESMKYWVKEYHVDGFRVDLMGVHDIETMNLISKELHELKPDILIYGEGWTAGASPLADSVRAIKANAWKLDKIAVFSDDIRDGIKGSVFEHKEKGFASGRTEMEESIKFGITAACRHPQVNYAKVNYSKSSYAAQPSQVISYCSCHDNHTLWDKLVISTPYIDEQVRTDMHKLALSIVLTSQGISFLHAGTEFMRSKKGVENSFESPDSINAIDWDLKSKNKDVFDYIKELIKLRKEHPAFRMTRQEDIASGIIFRSNLPEGLLSFTIDGTLSGDSWKKIQVFFNGSGKQQPIIIPKNWNAAVLNNVVTDINEKILSSIDLKPYSCTILYQKE